MKEMKSFIVSHFTVPLYCPTEMSLVIEDISSLKQYP